MWLELTKWLVVTLGGGFILFLLGRFYESMKPARTENWHQQVERHLQEADALIERFIKVEQQLKALEREVAGNQALAMEERRQLMLTIGDLHEKLDRLMERLLDRVSGKN